VFDDDGEQSPEEKRAEDLVPKTRDMAAEITPTVAQEDDGEDLLEGNLLERRDEAADIVVDNETAYAFWAAVIYVNVGLLLVTLGPMLVVFRGRTQVGALMVVLGGFALYRAYTVYKGYTASDEESETGEVAETDEESETVDDERPEPSTDDEGSDEADPDDD